MHWRRAEKRAKVSVLSREMYMCVTLCDGKDDIGRLTGASGRARAGAVTGK